MQAALSRLFQPMYRLHIGRVRTYKYDQNFETQNNVVRNNVTLSCDAYVLAYWCILAAAVFRLALVFAVVVQIYPIHTTDNSLHPAYSLLASWVLVYCALDDWHILVHVRVVTVIQ